MNSSVIRSVCLVATGWQMLVANSPTAVAAESPTVTFVQKHDQVQVLLKGRVIAKYIYRDSKIPRPYFAQVCAPDGRQVTRNQPPITGVDAVDHDTFHPGLWMTFGDLGGADFWRNEARVQHEAFVVEPIASDGAGRFSVRNRYEASDGKVVCYEVCRFIFQVRGNHNDAYLLLWESTFSNPEQEFYFGDQEEMGLGVRVSTPITVTRGGTIRDADGRRNEAAIWGNSAAWCDYSGTIDGQRVGVTLFDHPENFRKNWYHARDYGVLVANPFGRQAYKKGEPSKVFVKPGESFRLQYGISVYSHAADVTADQESAREEYLRLAAAQDN